MKFNIVSVYVPFVAFAFAIIFLSSNEVLAAPLPASLFWTVAKSAIIKRTPADPTPVPENPNPLPTIPQPNPNPIPGPKHNPEPFPKPKPEPKPKYGGEWPPPTGKIPGTTPKLQEPPTGYPGNTGSKVKMPRYQ